MEPHYWPSLYPGIGVGLLVGFAIGGWLPLLIGAVGGLIGAMLGLVINGWLGLTDSFLALAIPVLCSAVVAWVAIFLIETMRTGMLRSKT